MTKPPETTIVHTYPTALAFVNRHGPEAVVLLDDLVAHAELRDGRLVVEASVRQIAGRLGFTSKDTVHRRLRQLLSAGVIARVPIDGSNQFACPAYVLRLDSTGISRTAFPSRSA